MASVPSPSTVEVELQGDGSVLLTADHDLSSRHRLYLRSVLGGQSNDGGRQWVIPVRQLTSAELIGRLHDQLQRDGVAVILVGEAERQAEQQLERRRSFARTMDAGRSFHEAGTDLHAESISGQLELVGWNFTARSLRPHQMAAVAHALTVIHAANFSVPGSGKTAATLAVIAAHLAAETIETVIVVGPLASFTPWEQEAAIALPGVLRVQRVRGNNAASRTWIYRAAEPRDLLLLTYPTIVADLNEILRLAERRKVLLVVDESHRIKRFRGGQWAPAMVRLASSAHVRIILSGTPMPQGPLDLWSQLNVLWPHEELTGSRAAFKARADSQFDRLIDHVRPAYTRTPKSALGIPPYEVIRHPVEAAPVQAEVIDLITARFRRQLTDAASWTEKLNLLRRARPLRLLQAASNPDLLNLSDGFFELPPLPSDGGTLMERLAGYRDHEVPAKFIAALDILAEQVEAGQKTVVWTSFIKNIDQFAHLCRRRFDGLEVYTVDGRVPVADVDLGSLPIGDPGEEMDATRERRIHAFLNSEQPAILIANPAACGESVSLHMACTSAIYLDRTYDCARYLQSVDRIHRLGLPQDATVRVHLLQTTLDGADTTDQLVDASLLGKQALMERLLEGGELIPAQIPTEGDAATGDDEDLIALIRFLLGQ